MASKRDKPSRSRHSESALDAVKSPGRGNCPGWQISGGGFRLHRIRKGCTQTEAPRYNTATTQTEGSTRLPAQTRTRRSAPHLPAPGAPSPQRGRPSPSPCRRHRPGAGARRPPRPCPPPSCQRSPPGAARGRPSAAPCPCRGPLVLSRRSRRRRCGRPRGVSGEELSEPGRAGPWLAGQCGAS